jgi:hypothetical protein
MYGEDGAQDLAKALRLPERTWQNFEAGVQMPGEVILRFLLVTGTEPHWLLTGEGNRYRAPSEMAGSERDATEDRQKSSLARPRRRPRNDDASSSLGS